MARKSEWDKHIKDKLIEIEGWARDGYTDKMIAERLGIAEKTLYEYKNKYKQFGEALKKGKEKVDYAVENALLKEALIGNVTAQIFWLKNRRRDKWKNRWDIDQTIDGNMNHNIEGIKELTTEELKKLIEKIPNDDDEE